MNRTIMLYLGAFAAWAILAFGRAVELVAGLFGKGEE